jgi:hypothetical protein
MLPDIALLGAVHADIPNLLVCEGDSQAHVSKKFLTFFKVF